MRLRRCWSTVWATAAPSYQHIVPVNDIADHVPTVHCQCLPEKVLIHDGPHVFAVQFRHNAFDGRLL